MDFHEKNVSSKLIENFMRTPYPITVGIDPVDMHLSVVRPVEVHEVRETSSLPPLIHRPSQLEEIGTKNERIHERPEEDQPRGESMDITNRGPGGYFLLIL